MLSWSELENACSQCTKCALYESRTNVVFGVGNQSAEVLFVGEGPGEQEDKKGEPFVGRAGQLLDDMLKIIGLDRTKNIYIANIVKCRPPKNRDPLNTEQDACIDWLRGQFRLLKPKIVVCLGRIAAYRLIGEDFKITRDHGKWYDKDGVKFMALYHPAALLRDPGRRPETFVDLKELERMIKEIAPDSYIMP
jgi:DNA polymerase